MKKPILLLSFFLLLTQLNWAQDTNDDYERWKYLLEDTGDVLQVALPVTAGLMTIFEKDYKGTKKFAFSYGTTIALTYSLKHIIKKKRPEGSDKFDSFPSGHTSSAFSGASFIQRRYGWKWGAPAYILAGITGISRMEGPIAYHDIWDVMVGAAIGIGSTYLFTKPHQTESAELGFYSYKDSYVLTFKYQF